MGGVNTSIMKHHSPIPVAPHVPRISPPAIQGLRCPLETPVSYVTPVGGNKLLQALAVLVEIM